MHYRTKGFNNACILFYITLVNIVYTNIIIKIYGIFAVDSNLIVRYSNGWKNHKNASVLLSYRLLYST